MKKELRIPSASVVAKGLRSVLRNASDDNQDIDVRLRLIAPDGHNIHWGDPSYDLDHNGFWGASSLSDWMNEEDLLDIAEELIDQAAGQAAECGFKIIED